MEKELYSVAETLGKFNLGRTTFYKLVKEKEIPIIRRGRRTFVARTDAEAWVEGLRQKTMGGQP